MGYIYVPASVVTVPAASASVVHIIGGSGALSSEDDATYVDFTTFHVDRRAEVRFPATALPDDVIPDVVDLVYRFRGPEDLVRAMFGYSLVVGSGAMSSAISSPSAADNTWRTDVYPDLPGLTAQRVEDGTVEYSITPGRIWLRATTAGGITADTLLQVSYVALRLTVPDETPHRRIVRRNGDGRAGGARRVGNRPKTIQGSNRRGPEAIV